MGCRASVPGTNEEIEEATPGIRPIRRRIEEIKRRTRSITISTPSSKKLLQDGDQDEVDEHPLPISHYHECSKSMSLTEIKEEWCSNFEKEGKVLESEKNVVGDEKRSEKIERVEKKDIEEDEDGDIDEAEEFAPGSPSFREYYIASVGNSMDSADTDKDEDVSNGEKMVKKTRRNESIVSEGSTSALVNKENKGRRFRRGLPKGSQAAVKNLLNVKSCYSPCMPSHENSQILNVKVTAA